MLAGAWYPLSTLASRRRIPASRRFDSVPESQKTVLSQLPAVGRLLETRRFRALSESFGRPLVTTALRAEISELRRAVRAAAVPAGFSRDPEAWLAAAVQSRLDRAGGPDLRRVINATGIVVHTNLGRAPLSESAARAVFRAASGYSDLEFDLASAARGSRQATPRRTVRGHVPRESLGRHRKRRRRGPAGARHPRRRKGGGRVAGGTRRDRGFLPHSGHPGEERRAARRGRHDEPHPHRRLPARHNRERRPGRSAPQGPSVQFPDRRFHRSGVHERTRLVGRRVRNPR